MRNQKVRTMKNKKELLLKITNDEMREKIKDLKITMMSLENENNNVFGDEEIYRKAYLFNSLSDIEKNLYGLYIFLESYQSMEKYLNVKKSTIAKALNDIKDKLKIKYEEDVR